MAGQGRPWIRRTDARGQVTFDVYSTSGQLIASAELGKYRNPTHLPFIIRGDNVYAVVLDEDDVQHVVRFAIQRSNR